MSDQKRKSLDEYKEESENFESRFEQLFAKEDNESERKQLVNKITIWLQTIAGQGSFIPTGSGERQAFRSLLERWITKFRRQGLPWEGIDSLADFDPKAGIVLTGDCPYPGLEPYTERWRTSFFGREGLIDDSLKYLERQGNRILLIIGASGSGKSSLALAGILPQLVERHEGVWLFAPRFTPGAHPLAELAESVARAIGHPGKAGEIERGLALKPGEALAQLAALCGNKPLMLFIDQFEEFFTLCRDTGQQKVFAKVLVALADAGASVGDFCCRILLTLRRDHVQRFEDDNILKRLIGEDNQLPLYGIGFADIRRAIKEPAEKVGLRFVPATLIDLLASQTTGPANGLPLLQFALRRLWDTRPTNDSGQPLDLVTDEMVKALPDVERALGTVADAIFLRWSPSQRRICDRLLLELVVLDENFEEPLRRRRNEGELRGVLQARFPAVADDVDKVVGDLMAAGLLRRFGESPDYQIEVAHEALLRRWDHISQQLTGDEVKERLHRIKQIGREARDWMVNGNKDDYLKLKGEPLDHANADARDGWLAEGDLTAYVAACGRKEAAEKIFQQQAREEKERADAAEKAHAAAERERLEAETHRLEEERQRLEAEAKAAKAEADRQEAEAKAEKAKKWRLVFSIGAAAALIFAGGSWIEYYKVKNLNTDLKNTKNSAQTERNRAEATVGFLIGEKFLAAIRPVGRTSIMQTVQDRVDKDLNALGEINPDRIDSTELHNNPSRIRNHGLALRNKGDLATDKGNLGDARVNYEGAEKIFRTLHEAEPKNNEWIAELGRTFRRLGDTLVDQGYLTEAAKKYEDAKTFWNKVVPSALKKTSVREWTKYSNAKAEPDELKSALCELALCHAGIGRIYSDQGELEKAFQELDEALELVTPLDDKKNADSDILKANLLKVLVEGMDGKASVFQEMGKDKESRKLYGESSKVVKRWIEAHPLAADALQADAVAVSRMTNMLFNEGRFREALEQSQQLHERVKRLKQWDPSNKKWLRDWAVTKTWIADARILLKTQEEQEELESARKDYVDALEKMNDLVKKDDINASWKTDLAYIRTGYARAMPSKEARIAWAQCRKAIHLSQQVADLDASNARAKHDLARLYIKTGRISPRIEDEVQNYRSAREIASLLVKEHNRNVSYMLLLHEAYLSESDGLRKIGKQKAAIEAERKADDILQRARAKFPRNAVLDYTEALRWNKRADEAQHNGKDGEALGAYRKAAERSRKAAQYSPDNPVYVDYLLRNLEAIAQLYGDKKNWEAAIRERKEALDAAKKTVDLRPRNDNYRNRLFAVYDWLGYSYKKAGEAQRAMDIYQDGIKDLERIINMEEVRPGTAQDYRNLGFLHKQLGDAHNPHHLFLISNKEEPDRKDDLDKALGSYQQMLNQYEKAKSLDPTSEQLNKDLARGHAEIADISRRIALQEKAPFKSLKANQQALEATQRAVKLEPDDTDYHIKLAGIYRDIGDTLYNLTRPDVLGVTEDSCQKMIEYAEKVAKLKPQDAIYFNYLGLARFKKGKVLAEKGETKEAIIELSKAAGDVLEAVKKDKEQPTYRENLAIAHEHIAELKYKGNDQSGALQSYKDTVAAAEAGLKIYPKNTRLITKAYVGYAKIGELQHKSGNGVDALAAFQHALVFAKQAQELDSKESDIKKDIATIRQWMEILSKK